MVYPLLILDFVLIVQSKVMELWTGLHFKKLGYYTYIGPEGRHSQSLRPFMSWLMKEPLIFFILSFYDLVHCTSSSVSVQIPRLDTISKVVELVTCG